MKPQEIAQQAISKMDKKITNEIFLIIQNDPELMYKYLKAVEQSDLGTVNRTIGKEVKRSYRLNNINERDNSPVCTLIQSHQVFE